jgi:hypothetical protein
MARKGFARAFLLSLAAGLVLGRGAVQAQPDAAFTDDFRLEDCTFANEGRNPYFSIEPGDRFRFEGEEDGEAVVLLIRVLGKTKNIRLTTESGDQLRVKARVVEEREWVDGELVEVSRNFFARCEETNDVFYFGENVDNYEDGEIANHNGTWLAGRDGALPGLIMPGTFLLGSRYFQEIAPGVALDRGENVAMGLDVEVPAGSFHGCVQVRETNSLEPGSEGLKTYCPGVGLVIDEAAELVDFDVEDDDEGED